MLPKWDGVFREICERTGRSIVFFSYHNTASTLVEARLKAAGVNAVFLPFVSVMHFYDLLSLADVTLDTFGWSGGITTILALQHKRPVVTLPGEFRRGRHALAFLRAANVPGLVASDTADYIDLATNSDRRAEAMQSLDVDALFDDKASVTDLEDFLFSVARA